MPVPDSVRAMADDRATTPTAPLADFIAAYAEDSNWWWRIACGHHENLFDAALDRITELELAIMTAADAAQQTMDLAAQAKDEIDKTEDAINQRWPDPAIARVRAQIAEELKHGPIATYYALRMRAALEGSDD